MAIVKSTGVTPTEKVLADLCERSFLKLWSYPNPIKEDQNELCDLLAVFDNHVFIFFDRESRQFDASDKDPLLTWQRWKRRVIDAQVRSTHGAERYLRSGRGIFLDRERTVPFPITFDKETATIHKIIIAHGAQEACAAFSPDNVYGSLAISYGAAKLTSAFPFMVNLDSSDPVHIFDSHNLPIILGELDTFFDFCSYLDAKINAIRSLDGLCYCGEEDLLAHYWTNFDEMKNQHFIGTKEKDINLVMIGEGEWKDFSELEIYRRKKIDDKISYLWDELIQRTCQNALDGTLLGNANLLRGESAIHEMAREPRFSRRGLAAHMMRAIENFPETHKPIVRHVSFMPSFYREKAYVFLQLRKAQIADYENEYRPKRQALLEIACGAAKNRFEHLKKIVGIAIDAPKFSKRNSEDFILMDCADWPLERRANYERANEGLNFFQTSRIRERRVKLTEFPDIAKAATRSPGRVKVGRNDPCPCGSGKKYKKCCIGGVPALF